MPPPSRGPDGEDVDRLGALDGTRRRSGASVQPDLGAAQYGPLMATRRHWVIAVPRDHPIRGVRGGFVMANHGKRPPLIRMSRGDRILIYSPTTTYPHGERLRAVTVVGEVNGDEPEPSDVIAGGFHRAASLREIEPLPLQEIREHLPVSRIRFGFWRDGSLSRVRPPQTEPSAVQ